MIYTGNLRDTNDEELLTSDDRIMYIGFNDRYVVLIIETFLFLGDESKLVLYYDKEHPENMRVVHESDVVSESSYDNFDYDNLLEMNQFIKEKNIKMYDRNQFISEFEK